ncbi:olfactory receptor 4M1-like isoform X3 [Brienomyrus brachyistius]|uniref:olfactory receptor 4M1-like isoform X3 n=1 Tax=Brienomyrus brachyistius TaxID=42636 RepID=UPI0020B180A1|nr:olfactory receptor 4M1-like isoform X3 [Brienomyrus brachyistius]XP_048839341.1 olfactory receptor 4M1-like isoform X3 [Brienomyrus brachyistius]
MKTSSVQYYPRRTPARPSRYILLKMETSTVAYITLKALNESRTNRYVIFAFSLQGYIFTLFLNLTIIITVLLEKDLHQPMYIFLCNLCINGLYGTVGFYPKFLSDLFSDTYLISYSGCLLQTFVIFSYALCEFTNLTVMAIDRYVAICRPLHYSTVMTPVTICKLLIFIWMVPFFSILCSIILNITLPYCGLYVSTLYCKITISTCKQDSVRFAFNGTFGSMYLLMATFVIYSYGKIISACRKSKENRAKFMQTCLPHLISCINYVFITFLDGFSGTNFPQWFSGFISVAFLVNPPIINPIIYGINLRSIRRKVCKCCKRRQVLECGFTF